MLFEKELDKVYNKDAPEDDMLERAEEMERMREHVFKESDVDRNNLISFEEFLSETKVRSRDEMNERNYHLILLSLHISFIPFIIILERRIRQRPWMGYAGRGGPLHRRGVPRLRDAAPTRGQRFHAAARSPATGRCRSTKPPGSFVFPT